MIGLDVLLGDDGLRGALAGKRIGLLCNAASVTTGYVPAAAALGRAGLDVRVLFGPEHGFFGAAQDMEAVTRPERSSVAPVVSLYGTKFEELSPRPEHLADLDVVVSDLPDVGSRYYTFVWSTALMMKACAARGLPVWVLDRPNPIGLTHVEGNLFDDERLLSFVGLYDVPVRHGMTAGEIARFVNAEHRLGCDLTVVPMKGDTSEGPWVLPSPNMPSKETALVYPGGCLVEGTNLSEGRGTTRPFELVGAPWLDAHTAADAVNGFGLPGVVFRPHTFEPTFQKHAGKLCGGIQVHVTDPESFRPYETYLRLVKALRDIDPAAFRWRTEAYEYRSDVPAIDLLTGTSRYRTLVEAGEPLDEWIANFASDVARFTPIRERHLLYRRGPRVLLVVGAHESGKTTLLVKLVEALVAKGRRVATVKHTDHEYDTDVPGKDSQRHKAAGAEPAILVAGRRSARHRVAAERPTLADVLAEIPGADIVLVEGYKREPFPKIEVVRAATGRTPVALEDPGVVAVVTDTATVHDSGIPRFGFEDMDVLLALVERLLA